MASSLVAVPGLTFQFRLNDDRRVEVEVHRNRNLFGVLSVARGETVEISHPDNPSHVVLRVEEADGDLAFTGVAGTLPCSICAAPRAAQDIAPQSSDLGDTVTWVPICGRHDDWWDGADWGPIPFQALTTPAPAEVT